MSLSNSQADAAEAIKSIVAASDAAATQSIEKAIEAGHALIAAKDTAPHGTWLPFLARAGVPERKAQRLMKLAASGLKSDTVSDLGGIIAATSFADKVVRFITLLEALDDTNARDKNSATVAAASEIWGDIGGGVCRLCAGEPSRMKQLIPSA